MLGETWLKRFRLTTFPFETDDVCYMRETLNYASAPPRRWISVVLWVSGALAFGIIGLVLFRFDWWRDSGSRVPTATESVLQRGPLWFIFPYPFATPTEGGLH